MLKVFSLFFLLLKISLEFLLSGLSLDSFNLFHSSLHAQLLQSCPTRCNFCLWYSPGKNTGMGCYAFPQGIFPTQKLKLWGPVSPALNHLGSPILHFPPSKI